MYQTLKVQFEVRYKTSVFLIKYMITFKRTRGLSTAACFKHGNNFCACAVSALILLTVVNLSLKLNSAISISYTTWNASPFDAAFRLFWRFFTAHTCYVLKHAHTEVHDLLKYPIGLSEIMITVRAYFNVLGGTFVPVDFESGPRELSICG